MSAFLYERFPHNDNDADADADADIDEQDAYDSPTGSDSQQRRQRPKIRRCRLTAHQLQTLNRVFEQDYQPSMETRIALGAQLGMETKQVSAWFQNKRQKLKNATPIPFSSSSLPPSSLPRDFDSQPPQHSDYRPQSIYHSRELPQPDYNRYQQPYSSYARPIHHRSFTPLDHAPNFIDRYPPPHLYHQEHHFDMKPSATTFQLSPHTTNNNYIPTAPAGSVGMLDRVMTRSRSSSTQSRSRSASTESRYTGTTDFMPQSTHAEGIKGYQPHQQTILSASTKKEPFDDNHHKLMLRVPTPPPEVVQPLKKSSHVTATNRRTSTRARSARLAASPILTSNRHLSVTGSPASTHNDGPSKRLTRSRMSASQRSYLHSIYEDNPEPTMAERQVIADKLGVQIGKITNWFRNLRQSVRRGKLLDAKLTSTRATTAETRDEDEEEHEMDVEDEEGSASEDEQPSTSPVPPPTVAPATVAPAAAPAADIVPGKGAYSTHSLIVASEYAALHSPPEIYAEAEGSDDEEEEEAHEALTPHPSPESKLAHSFGGPSHLNVNSSTPENILGSPTPSRGGISLPSINITLAQDEKKQTQHHQEQKFRSAVEDAMLLLHFRQNCDVKDIHHGVVVGRPTSPTLY